MDTALVILIVIAVLVVVVVAVLVAKRRKEAQLEEQRHQAEEEPQGLCEAVTHTGEAGPCRLERRLPGEERIAPVRGHVRPGRILQHGRPELTQGAVGLRERHAIAQAANQVHPVRSR